MMQDHGQKLAELLRQVDNIKGGEDLKQVWLSLSAPERAMLKETAYLGRLTQMGVLRIGLRLAASAIAQFVRGR